MVNNPSRAFRDMADRIDALKEGEFGGAFIVVSPADSASGAQSDELAMLLSGPKPDLAFFWSMVKSKVELAQVEFERHHRERDMPFGVR